MKRFFSLLTVLAMLGLASCATTDGHHDHGDGEECCSTTGTCCK